MALTTIAKYVLAFVFGFAVFMLGSPMMAEIRYESGLWDDMPTSMLAFGDQIHGVWLMLAIVIAAIIVFGAITEAQRSRALG
jgi:hypothetical protein